MGTLRQKATKSRLAYSKDGEMASMRVSSAMQCKLHNLHLETVVVECVHLALLPLQAVASGMRSIKEFNSMEINDLIK